MSITKAVVHGVASMVVVVLGSVLSEVIKKRIEVFQMISERVVFLLQDVGKFPISDSIAGIVIPVGLLMGVWVFVYEIRAMSS